MRIIEVSASVSKKISVAQYESEDYFISMKATIDEGDDVQNVVDIIYNELWKQMMPRAAEAKKIGSQYSGVDRSKKLEQNAQMGRMDTASTFQKQFGHTLKIQESE